MEAQARNGLGPGLALLLPLKVCLGLGLEKPGSGPYFAIPNFELVIIQWFISVLECWILYYLLLH